MNFTEPVIFEILVLPRVRKYLTVHLAGIFLWAIAQSEKVLMYTSYKENKQRRHFPLQLTAEISIGIYEFDKSRQFSLLNHAEVLVFNRFIDSIIMNELITLANSSNLRTMQTSTNKS